MMVKEEDQTKEGGLSVGKMEIWGNRTTPSPSSQTQMVANTLEIMKSLGMVFLFLYLFYFLSHFSFSFLSSLFLLFNSSVFVL